MPLSFESYVRYGDHADGTPAHVHVKADTFVELHRALAALAELHRDADFLKGKTGAEVVVPERHVTGDGHEYLGFCLPDRPHVKVNFGTSTDKAHPVPFFPKGDKGFYGGSDADVAAAPAPARPSRPAISPGSGRSEGQPAAIAAFESHAQLMQLNGDGCTALLKTFGVGRLGDLTAEQLAEATGLVDTPEAAAQFNAQGWAHKTAGKVAAAPARQRGPVAERARAAARGLFEGPVLGRVIATIDKAAVAVDEPAAA